MQNIDQYNLLKILFIAEENEERSMIEPNSRDEPKVKELMKVGLISLPKSTPFLS